MSELVKTLNNYAYHYYVLDNPIVSDKEYDALYDELTALEKSLNITLADSPTLRVGGDILKGFKKYTHKKRLYSLDKCQTKEELKKWTEKILAAYGAVRFTVEYKFDGLSVNLFYKDGLLQTAATRGNGTVGEDVTAQIKTVKTVPLKIPFSGECEVQGEVIMRKSALAEYNEKNPQDPLKNERNAAAGAVRNLDPKVTAGRKLDVIVYGVGYISEENFNTEKSFKNGGIEPRIPGEKSALKSNIKDDAEARITSEKDTEKNIENDGAEQRKTIGSKGVKARKITGQDAEKNIENGGTESRIFTTQTGMIEFLKNNGFKTADYFKTAETSAALAAEITEIEARRESLDYLIDGAVIKVDDLNIRAELGYTEKFPRYAVAYKFEAEEAATVLRDVVWQVSRTGKLNPLAVLDPVELAGVTVSRATLSNFSEIKRKDIRINSRVFVRRSNDVIPEITGIAEHFADSVPVEPPLVCPSCGGELRADSVFIYCLNKTDCRGVIVSKLSHYASRGAMDIEGLSEKTIEAFYDGLNVRSIADLYRLDFDGLTALDGFRDKKARNIIDAIERSKNAGLADFIYALGIENVGKKAAKELAANFKSMEGMERASRAEIEGIRDFGEVTASCVYDFFRNEKNLKEIGEIFSLGVKLKNYESKPGRTGVFSGKNVVLTGTLERYKRSEAKEMIESLGGETSDAVTLKVNLVVAGADAGNKLEKAKKLGIEIISETEFQKMIENGKRG
jgi:DNA ligase (NAD+)